MEIYDLYPIIKSLHIVFVVTWFAGLFYIVRLFVNHSEALYKPEPERSILIKQYKKMEKPLWRGITYPSMFLALVFGVTMFFLNPVLIKLPYMHLKLGFVVLLLAYHFYCGWLFSKYQKDEDVSSSFALRIWNEVASVLLVAIVFIIVMKQQLNFVYFGISILVFCLLLLIIIIRLWKARNRKNLKHQTSDTSLPMDES